MKSGKYNMEIKDCKFDTKTGELISTLQVMGGPNDGKIIVTKRKRGR